HPLAEAIRPCKDTLCRAQNSKGGEISIALQPWPQAGTQERGLSCTRGSIDRYDTRRAAAANMADLTQGAQDVCFAPKEDAGIFLREGSKTRIWLRLR